MKTKSRDAVFTFTDVSLTLKDKTILTNINGEARSGQMLAIMGPTGSGKTSLLNILAGNVPLTSGTITLNGKSFIKLQRRKLAYVLQSDIFLSRLTLRETLYFTAMIRLPDHVSKTDKMARIDEIVDALHLRKCLDTIIGDFMHRGLSGGEKKRANIACELLTDPNIMLIDEPTSGLDSSTAQVLMEELLDYASQYNKTILTTIHQPSSQIYHMFSSLLLLVNGHAAYFGDAHTALQYFSDLGLTVPDNYNPADIMLELITINTEVLNRILTASDKRNNFRVETDNSVLSITKEKHIEEVQTTRMMTSHMNGTSMKTPSHDVVVGLRYSKRDPSEIVLDVSSFDHVTTSGIEFPIHKKWGASYWTQFCMLCWRNSKQSRWRIFDDCTVAYTLIVGCTFSIMYYQTSDSIENLHNRMGAVFFPIVFWGFAMVTDSVTSFMGEREVVRKERKSGAYRLSAYYMAKMISDLPMMLVLPVLQLTAMYWLAGIGGPLKYATFLGINLLNCFTMQSIGYVIGACVHKFKYSITAANTMMTVFFLLGGFFNTSLPTWFSWAKYLSLLHYSFAAILTLLFGDMEPVRFSLAKWLAVGMNDSQSRNVPDDFERIVHAVFNICGNSNMFTVCKNETQIISGSDVLSSVGIELPVYCCVGTLVALIILLRILGYNAIKYKL